MAISADSIKSPIKSRLLDMIESRREFIKHSNFLSSLGITIKWKSTLFVGLYRIRCRAIYR
jgi:hypothetical protein